MAEFLQPILPRLTFVFGEVRNPIRTCMRDFFDTGT